MTTTPDNPQNPLARLLGDVKQQLHDEDPAAFHGDTGPGNCPRCNPTTPAGGTPTEYQCPQCARWAEWTDGAMRSAGEPEDEFWCQTCGAQSPLSACASRTPAGGGDPR